MVSAGPIAKPSRADSTRGTTSTFCTRHSCSRPRMLATTSCRSSSGCSAQACTSTRSGDETRRQSARRLRRCPTPQPSLPVRRPRPETAAARGSRRPGRPTPRARAGPPPGARSSVAGGRGIGSTESPSTASCCDSSRVSAIPQRRDCRAGLQKVGGVRRRQGGAEQEAQVHLLVARSDRDLGRRQVQHAGRDLPGERIAAGSAAAIPARRGSTARCARPKLRAWPRTPLASSTSRTRPTSASTPGTVAGARPPVTISSGNAKGMSNT